MQGLVINAAIADALDVIGDRWSLLILRDVFLGRRRFNQLQQHTGAGKATLTRRLQQLIDSDVLYRRAYSDARFEYNLTEKGLGLYGPSLLAWYWEIAWSDGDELPANLLHSLCDSPLVPRAICRHCREDIQAGDLGWQQTDDALESQFGEIKTANRQRRVRNSQASGIDLSLTHIADLIGDRWTLLILIASLLGIQYHDDYQRQLGIATNVLSDRLKQLTGSNVLNRKPYQENPVRYAYQLSERGLSLVPLLLSLRQWAASWAQADQSSGLTHTPCGHELTIDIVCSGCHQKPWPEDVVFSSDVE